MLELEDVTKVYSTGAIEVRALDGVSLNVDEGEMVAIMGHSGSGKSTMMNILGCLDAPTSGRYRLDGVDVAGLNDNQLAAIRNRKIGFVFQSFNLLPRTSAQRNVELPLVYARRGQPGRPREGGAGAASGSGRGPGHMPNELSGGQQQRVAIARALVTNPAMILADEPTGALDSVSTDDVMKLLVELNEAGRTIVMITHEDDVASFATRVVRLRRRADRQRRPAPARGAAVNLGEALRIALRALRANRLRSVLTTTGHHHRRVGGDRAGRAGQRHPGRVHRAVLLADHADHRRHRAEGDRSAQPLTDADVDALADRAAGPGRRDRHPAGHGQCPAAAAGPGRLPHGDHRHDRELRRRHRPRPGRRLVLRRAAGAVEGQGRGARHRGRSPSCSRATPATRSASASGSAARRSG